VYAADALFYDLLFRFIMRYKIDRYCDIHISKLRPSAKMDVISFNPGVPFLRDRRESVCPGNGLIGDRRTSPGY